MTEAAGGPPSSVGEGVVFALSGSRSAFTLRLLLQVAGRPWFWILVDEWQRTRLSTQGAARPPHLRWRRSRTSPSSLLYVPSHSVRVRWRPVVRAGRRRRHGPIKTQTKRNERAPYAAPTCRRRQEGKRGERPEAKGRGRGMQGGHVGACGAPGTNCMSGGGVPAGREEVHANTAPTQMAG